MAELEPPDRVLAADGARLDRVAEAFALVIDAKSPFTAHTASILGRTPGLGDLAEVAASHHEKLDGSGYHRGLRGDQLSPPVRLLAVADIFEALTARRPYRAPLGDTEAFALMQSDAGSKLCPDALGALEASHDAVTRTAPAQPRAA